MAPGLLSGAVLGFAASLGEFGATITFVSNVPGQTQTLPLAIYSALQQPGGDAAAARLVAAVGAARASPRSRWRSGATAGCRAGVSAMPHAAAAGARDRG